MGFVVGTRVCPETEVVMPRGVWALLRVYKGGGIVVMVGKWTQLMIKRSDDRSSQAPCAHYLCFVSLLSSYDFVKA